MKPEKIPDIKSEPIQTIPERSKNSKLITRLVIGALLVIAIGIGTLLYWAAENTDVLKVKTNPIPTRTIRDHPTAGGVVILNVNYCKNSDVVGTLRTSFVSESREVFLPLGEERTPKGCHDIELPVLIPKDMPADTYKVKLRATYDVNPVKKNIVIDYFSNPIVIDPTVPLNDRN